MFQVKVSTVFGILNEKQVRTFSATAPYLQNALPPHMRGAGTQKKEVPVLLCVDL